MLKMFQCSDFVREYANDGQHKEQKTRYTLTGERVKADNIKHTDGTDCLHYQIKSARATVCKGLDLIGYLTRDRATEYIYATETVLYIMSKTEYIEFCVAFGTVTRESDKNGGAVKIRLKSESKALLQWLEERARE